MILDWTEEEPLTEQAQQFTMNRYIDWCDTRGHRLTVVRVVSYLSKWPSFDSICSTNAFEESGAHTKFAGDICHRFMEMLFQLIQLDQSFVRHDGQMVGLEWSGH